jgi:hypothetical protein
MEPEGVFRPIAAFGAARRSRHSCRAQHFVGWNINQRDKDDARQGFESFEIIGLDRLRVTSGMA